MTITLRPARPLDAGTLGAMLTEAGKAHDWKPHLHTAAQDIAHVSKMIDRGWVTVACDGSGCVLGFIARDDDNVLALFVNAAARGQGVGRHLLNAAKRAAPRLTLWTFERNRAAQRFYEREGFVIAKRTDGSGNEERLPEVRYIWEKPAPAPAKGNPDQSKETQP